MSTLPLIFGTFVGLFVVERFWPANELPRVRAWVPRVILINVVQLGIVILAGQAWDQWFQRLSLFHLAEHRGLWFQALCAYLLSTFIYYWWHRFRHESHWLWNIFHQLHHSPRRIELITSFYKHPVEILVNSILSAAIVFLFLGVSPAAGALYTLMTAVAEFFYHWNIRTPAWIGRAIQRPESHRIHHQRGRHTNNYADLPIFDILFGTFQNAGPIGVACGFRRRREDRFEDMLVFKNVNSPRSDGRPPLHLLPTCIGCSKRWACQESRERSAAKEAP